MLDENLHMTYLLFITHTHTSNVFSAHCLVFLPLPFHVVADDGRERVRDDGDGGECKRGVLGAFALFVVHERPDGAQEVRRDGDAGDVNVEHELPCPGPVEHWRYGGDYRGDQRGDREAVVTLPDVHVHQVEAYQRGEEQNGKKQEYELSHG